MILGMLTCLVGLVAARIVSGHGTTEARPVIFVLLIHGVTMYG